MITVDNIRTLATKHQTTELNIRREYVQHLFLSWLYRNPDTTKLCFKGGTALRIVYGSPRFSEDLDFSAALEPRILKRSILWTLKEIQREGVKTQLLEAKTTSGGYLAIVSFLINTYQVTIQLEVSARNQSSQSEVITIISDFIPSYTLVALTRQQIVEEKIQALLSRGKPRDYYDLYFMLRGNLLSDEQKRQLPTITKKLQKVHIFFNRELRLFLPKSHWPVIKNFEQHLYQELTRYT